jgi:predicted Zn-dependent peptidase
MMPNLLPVQPVTLQNGVMLITEPIASVKTAAIGFWFYGGSRLEPASLRGVTHFTEHMIFKGTSSRTAFEIACAFDRMGGYINAYTERENVCMYCVVPSCHTDDALEIMCDMASHSVFNVQDLEKERKVIESEIITAQDDPDESALDAVGEAIWPHQMISASISGTVNDVEQLTREDLCGWYEQNFVHGDLCVCITGAFDERAAEHRLELLPVHNYLKKEILPVRMVKQYQNQHPEWKNGITFISSPFKQEQFFLLYPVKYPVNEKVYYTLSVINALTGDTMSSRLFQALREKGGYCYNVYSFTSFYADTACWCAYASSAKRNSDRILYDLHEEMKKLFDGPISEAEVEAAREHLCGEELISDADIENRMKLLERTGECGYPFRSTDERIALIRSVSIADIRLCLSSVIDRAQWSLVIYGPGLSIKEKNSIIKMFS